MRMEDEGRRMEDVELIPSRSYLNFIEVQVRSYKYSAEKTCNFLLISSKNRATSSKACLHTCICFDPLVACAGDSTAGELTSQVCCVKNSDKKC